MWLILCIAQLWAQENDGEGSLEKGFSVHGEAQRPQATILINKNNASAAYELQLRQDFLDKVLDSMKKEPL